MTDTDLLEKVYKVIMDWNNVSIRKQQAIEKIKEIVKEYTKQKKNQSELF